MYVVYGMCLVLKQLFCWKYQYNTSNLTNNYSFIHVSGCVGMIPGALLCPVIYVAAKTALTISVYHRLGEVVSIQRYVIKFVSDLHQVGGILRVLQFLPPIKLTATI
jgi:hypothetical protein